jgi:hypothetical protein
MASPLPKQPRHGLPPWQLAVCEDCERVASWLTQPGMVPPQAVKLLRKALRTYEKGADRG